MNIVWPWANFGNWTIFSVIGAIVIVAGLYIYGCGASEGQPGSKSSVEKVIPTTQSMATMNEGIMTSNQEVVAVNVTAIKSTDWTAWK